MFNIFTYLFFYRTGLCTKVSVLLYRISASLCEVNVNDSIQLYCRVNFILEVGNVLDITSNNEENLKPPLYDLLGIFFGLLLKQYRIYKTLCS